MGGRRARPLILLLWVGWLVVVARLAQLQLVEHPVWATEAAKLERSGAVLPYERGAILDAGGRVLVEDRSVYRLELVYREFRRGHPLGVVAHAWSALERRAVPLPEALDNLTPWAASLVRLSPAELHRFGRGGALEVGALRLEAAPRSNRQLRAARASDLRYYARALLDPDKLEARRLVKLERDEDESRSYLELVAGMRGLSPEELLIQRRAAWGDRVEGLRVLAKRLAEDLDGPGEVGLPPFEQLIADLEGWRRSVEDAAAARLFRETLGFSVGRLEPSTVLRYLDLDWLAEQLRWRPDRTADWVRSEREDWLRGWRGEFALPLLLAELRVRAERDLDAERALDLLMAVFAEPEGLVAALDGRELDWRRPGPLEVADDVAATLEVGRPDPAQDPLLPIWREPFASRFAQADPDWDDLLGLMPAAIAERVARELRTEHPALGVLDAADLPRILASSAGRGTPRHRARTLTIASGLLDALDAELQRGLVGRLARFSSNLGGAALVPSDERLDRLGERARHLLRDYGSRRARLVDEPSYEVVYLLTRDPERYPGLHARPERERIRGDRPDERGLPGAELLGTVSGLDPELAQRQRGDVLELRRLQRKVGRSADEDSRLQSLMRSLLLTGDDRGVSGVEAVWDAHLRGHNGYRERLGLEDVYGRGAVDGHVTPPVDGYDVALTIDSRLQLAAQQVINAPRHPPLDVVTDEGWYASPVGAIVLARPDGRVLAAASAPDQRAVSEALDAGLERAPWFDRSLRAPFFQPLGSVFKPFVALHALQERPGTIDAGFVHDCRVQPGERVAGWGGVNCNSTYGHGEVDMARAIAVSCNSYFARLADEFDTSDFELLGERFGLGLPTGVVPDDAPASRTLELLPVPFRWDRRAALDRQLRRAANGLQVVEVTPVQVARAMAGLATGGLPRMRLVDAIDGQPLPVEAPEPLPYDPSLMAAVRSMMVEVTNSRGGSAQATLSRERIGVTVAAKTGSADLQGRKQRGPDGKGVLLKHTWVAGWLPAEDPELVFVVFLDTTEVSSSKAAIYVAGQLLERPEVRELVGIEGGEASGW